MADNIKIHGKITVFKLGLLILGAHEGIVVLLGREPQILEIHHVMDDLGKDMGRVWEADSFEATHRSLEVELCRHREPDISTRGVMEVEYYGLEYAVDCEVPCGLAQATPAHEVCDVHNDICRVGAVVEGRKKRPRRGGVGFEGVNIRAIDEEKDDIVANFKACR